MLGKKSVYVDTMEFVYAQAAEHFPPKHRNLEYYRAGRECINVLRACRTHEIVVFSSMISRIEFQALHLDWSKRKRLVDLKMPFGFAFGEAHRNEDALFVRDLFTSAERTSLYEEVGDWFRTWKFNTLIRWVEAGNIPNWAEVTEVVLRYLPRGQIADALHLGAAIGLQCTKLFTNDSQLRNALAKMRDDRGLRHELEKRMLIDKGYGLPDAITDKAGLLS